MVSPAQFPIRKTSSAPQKPPTILVSVIVSNIGPFPIDPFWRVSIASPSRKQGIVCATKRPVAGPQTDNRPMNRRIAFQGEPGAYSHQACRETRPELEALPCRTFEDAIEAVRSGEAALAMLPVENLSIGRVADIHHLLPESHLHSVQESFVRVHINLLAIPGTPLSRIRTAISHTMLLGQCRDFLARHGIPRVTGADTAGS